MIEKLTIFVTWCNVNSGFFSLLLSVVAIIISIIAIKSQNEGAVFEKRISLYCEIERIYDIVKTIIEKSPKIHSKHCKCFVANLLFNYRSEENVILEKIEKLEQQNTDSDVEAQKKIDELIDKYIDIYVHKYMYSNFAKQTAIFYNEKIAKTANDLFDAYDSLLLGLIVMDGDDFTAWAKKASEIVEVFERESTLKKMKRKLPV